MCQSKADGGNRCFSCTNNLNANVLKKKRSAAKKKGDKEAAEKLNIEYLTTEEGIEQLEEAGELEHAAKFVERRNRKIASFNREFKQNKPPFLPYERRDERPLPGYRLPPIWNHDGFNVRKGQPRVHRETRKLHNPQGFDAAGFHANGTRYNAQGWDHEGYGRDGFDAQGFDRQGYDRDGYNADHFTRPKNVLELTRLTRPNKDGKRFQLEGFPEFDSDADIYGWIHGDQVGDTTHIKTGTHLNPAGQSYLKERSARRARGINSWLADPSIEKWWPQG
ncbi:hypothetical protein ACWG8W_06455 [Citricoccus zhacaiensis]